MKTDNQCSFTHTGVEMSDYATNIAFENKSVLLILTISFKTLHIWHMCPLRFDRFLL